MATTGGCQSSQYRPVGRYNRVHRHIGGTDLLGARRGLDVPGDKKRLAQGVSERKTTQLLIRRGLVISLWGYAVNLLVFFEGDNWQDLIAFDVLQCIGVGMVVFGSLSTRAPTWAFAFLALVTGWGGQFADRIKLPGYLGTMVNGLPPIAYFPLLPWLCFISMGILWGRALARWRGHQEQSDWVAIGLLLSGLVALAGMTWVDPSLGYRHPRLISILFDWGVVASLGAGIHAWCRLSKRRYALSWLRDMGQETLLIYVVHHLVGFRLFRLLGWVTGRSWRAQFGTLRVPQATLLLVGLVAGLYLVTRAWMAWKSKDTVFQRVSDALF